MECFGKKTNEISNLIVGFGVNYTPYGLSEEGNIAMTSSVRGMECDRIMIIIGPELYIDTNNQLSVRVSVRANLSDIYGIPAEDIKRMYRILMQDH
jgi:hypothetical protein